MEKNKYAIIKTINGDFSIEYTNSRDFINSIRTSIERGSLYEFTVGATRTIINSKNVVSIELASDSLAPYSPFKSQPVSPLTPEEERENQLMMQPDLVKFEAKAEGMRKMKAKEDAVRKNQFEEIYKTRKEDGKS